MIGVEVVCCSPADCRAAEGAGATRIELCGAILAGGLTPSLGLFEACRAATSLPIMVMIRPREGGFLYSDEEFSQMKIDAEEFVWRGAQGLVVGILNADGSVDGPRMKELAEVAKGKAELMCHRAFDVTPDPFAALDALTDCGFDRVLSSGQERDIHEGMPLLERLFAHAAGRIEVQPCEHIRAHNAPDVIARLNPKSVHLGPFLDASDPTSDLGRPVTYGGHKVLDAAQVAAVVRVARG
jgi:copper homeostasis protein